MQSPRAKPSILYPNSDFSLGVRDVDSEFLSTGNNLNSPSRRNSVCDLCGECLAVHEEEVDVALVEEGLATGRYHMASPLVGAETIDGMSDTAVNALGLSPARGNTFLCVALMSMEALRALLDDRNVLPCDNHLVVCFVAELSFFVFF